MSKKSEKLNWSTFFKPGMVPEDLRRRVIDYQKFELLNKILPDIFHKLKNKLTPIMGYSQLLSLKIDDGDVRDKLERIERNSEELSRLLDGLRDYFKKGISARSRICINDVIRGLAPFFSEISKKHGIKVEVDLEPSLPDQDLVYGQIELLVMNVIDNAVQAIANRSQGPEAGNIRVSAKLKEDETVLAVRDNGLGMTPDTLSRIWLPFYSEFPDGLGIGLLICEKVVSDHQGRFQVQSEKEIGTQFEFYFKLGSPA